MIPVVALGSSGVAASAIASSPKRSSGLVGATNESDHRGSREALHALLEAGRQASVKASNGVIHLTNTVRIPSAG